MNSFGQRTAVVPIADVLRKMLPAIENVDFLLLAEEIVQEVDIHAVRIINEREEAMQEALVAVMAYLGGVRSTQMDRIDDLESEVRRLTLALAARAGFEGDG